MERFGPTQRKPKVSVIVPLYGIGDYLFLQASAYAHGRDIAAYEFIYVVNSPELIEPLYREARIAQMIYGLTQTLVLLPGNVGFGTANNTGVQFARGDRLLCLDPDVFPRDPHWARRHLEILATLPEAQTRLFGTTLYYDDGSLMHGGMYFEVDAAIHASATSTMRRTMVRVEHSGKGAPPWANQYVASRPVPAVSGAFLSVDRAWFEQLSGFSEDYVFGHYEDADLCLKSLQAGRARLAAQHPHVAPRRQGVPPGAGARRRRPGEPLALRAHLDPDDRAGPGRPDAAAPPAATGCRRADGAADRARHAPRRCARRRGRGSSVARSRAARRRRHRRRSAA